MFFMHSDVKKKLQRSYGLLIGLLVPAGDLDWARE